VNKKHHFTLYPFKNLLEAFPYRLSLHLCMLANSASLLSGSWSFVLPSVEELVYFCLHEEEV
jgi:hypothetical protein